MSALACHHQSGAICLIVVWRSILTAMPDAGGTEEAR